MSPQKLFSIREASKQTGLTEDTIRYYEKISLLPAATRKENGHRIYDIGDIDRMKLIHCLKKTDLSLDDMKPFLKLADGGTLNMYPELYDKIQSHKEEIENRISDLKKIINLIDSNLEKNFHPDQNCSVNSS